MLINDVGKDLFEEINAGCAGGTTAGPTPKGRRRSAGSPARSTPTATPPARRRGARSPAVPSTESDRGELSGDLRRQVFLRRLLRQLDLLHRPGAAGRRHAVPVGPQRPRRSRRGRRRRPVLRPARQRAGPAHPLHGPSPRRGSWSRTAQLELPEGTTVRVAVRLAARTGQVTLTVNRSLSDYLIAAEPKTMTFTAANWDVPQALTITSALDADGTDEGARFGLWSPGVAAVRVRVTVVDADRPADAPRAVISIPRSGDTVSGTNAEFFGDGRGDASLRPRRVLCRQRPALHRSHQPIGAFPLRRRPRRVEHDTAGERRSHAQAAGLRRPGAERHS